MLFSPLGKSPPFYQLMVSACFAEPPPLYGLGGEIKLVFYKYSSGGGGLSKV
jgi:hypothetical protein